MGCGQQGLVYRADVGVGEADLRLAPTDREDVGTMVRVVYCVGESVVDALFVGRGEVDDDVGSGSQSRDNLDVHGDFDGALRGFDGGGGLLC
jgi:hypothetical protein